MQITPFLLFSLGSKAGVLNRGQIYPLGVSITYPGGKFNDAVDIFLQR